MGNPIDQNVKVGTIGELLVQTRLLQFDVQAAPPIKDSGNDLIAIKGDVFKGIQVKTSRGFKLVKGGLPERYHILAYVWLEGDGREIHLDQTQIFLVPRHEVNNVKASDDSLHRFLLTEEWVTELFQGPRNNN